MAKQITEAEYQEIIDHKHDGRSFSANDPANFKGFPIFSETPTHKAEEGTVVLKNNATSESIYVMFDGVWTQFASGGGAKVGKVTRTTGDGTGTEVITGLGFEPSCIEIYSAAVGAVNYSTCTGFSSGPSNMAYSERYNNGSGWTNATGVTKIIKVGDLSANDTEADVDSFDSDGFTLDFTVMGVNCDFIWKATK